MADQQDQSRTEQATPRRRDRAREEGQVVFSPDLSAGLMLLVVSLLGWLISTAQPHTMLAPFAEGFLHLEKRDWGHNETVLASQWLLTWLVTAVAIIGGITTGTTLLVTQLQSGFTVTTQPLVPKWEKLSLANGWQRLISIDSIIRGGMAIVKLATSIAVVYVLLWASIKNNQQLAAGISTSSASPFLSSLISAALGLSGVTLFWGIVDYGIRWLRHEQKLKMSRQEIKDEQKEDQIDPQIRGRMRRAQQAAAKRQRALQEVPSATMVITNPTHYAIALRYQTGTMSAPVIVAKGTDGFARKIAEMARLNGVPVFERKPLTRAIYAMADIGEEIPAPFYRAIAELLAHVYRIKGRTV